MILLTVISVLIVMSSHTFVVFCAKKRNREKTRSQALENSPQNSPCRVPVGKKATPVDREEGDSLKTRIGKRNNKESKEPDSTDEAFKDLVDRLAKKEKAPNSADSLIGDDDENPLAHFKMPERPVVKRNQDGTKLENIIEVQKRTPHESKASTPTGAAKTARDSSVIKDLPAAFRKSPKVSKKPIVSMVESPVTTDKTQSDPHSPVKNEGKSLGRVDARKPMERYISTYAMEHRADQSKNASKEPDPNAPHILNATHNK